MGMRLAFLKKALKADHGIDLDAIQDQNRRLRASLERITHFTFDMEYYPPGESPATAMVKEAQEALDKS